MSLSTHYPYSISAITNVLRAAQEPHLEAFGIVFKVRNNRIVNWMYGDPPALKSIATQKTTVAFPSPDDPNSAKILRELAMNLTAGTPFVALMICYTGNTPTAWKFVQLDFLRALTADEG